MTFQATKGCRSFVQVRLGGGGYPYQGYIELNVDNQGWKGVCDDAFDLNDAHVICRMLGYSSGASSAYTNSSPFGHGTSFNDFAVDDLQCQGTETSIADCQHSAWYIDNCSSSEWAGVQCAGDRFSVCDN